MIETLIYVYLAICVSMIIFNIVCIYYFHRRDKMILRRNKRFVEEILTQIQLEKPDKKHCKKLTKKLTNINYLMAFDEALEIAYEKEPEKMKTYMEQLSSIFLYLTLEYLKKEKMKAAYFPYIIKKYDILQGRNITLFTNAMLELVKDENLYCRENALQALYSIGNADSILEALKILDSSNFYHHSKMIYDGLLLFEGNREELDAKIWECFFSFSITMRTTLLNYFRFSSGDYCEQILRIMINKEEDNEIRYACIRYFTKYPYEPALAFLYDFAEQDQTFWEYTAITASALASYPSDKTINLLKELLCDENWYVRYNAAESLDKLGLRYEDLIDIFEGKDRYASEMLRYRFDKKNLTEGEANT